MIQTRRRSGLLTEVYNGVYAVGSVEDVPFGREAAALLAVARSVLSHLSAAVVWELIPLREAGRGLRHPGPIHVTVRGPRKSRAGIVVHRSSSLARADLTIRHGLPITSVARTLLDISEVLPTREVERALDEALARKLVTLEEIQRLLARTRNRRGVTIMRRLIAWRTTSAGGRTTWQRIAYKAFVAAGLPEPEQDVWYIGYQHDFLWREHGVTLEIDGYPWHSTKIGMERDREKETACKQHGLDPNRVSNSQVEGNILQVVALVAARLALREAAGRESAGA
jgi:very-short-patch-repair endonuclease